MQYLNTDPAEIFEKTHELSAEEKVSDLRSRLREAAEDAAYWQREANESAHLIMQLRAEKQADSCPVAGCVEEASKFSRSSLCIYHMLGATQDASSYWNSFPQDATPSRSVREARESVVYYLAMGDLIKIGKTVDLKQRLAHFYARESQLLAIEPGGLQRELERHRQFKACRVERELFSRSDELMAHIEAAREMFGDPKRFIGSRYQETA